MGPAGPVSKMLFMLQQANGYAPDSPVHHARRLVEELDHLKHQVSSVVNVPVDQPLTLGSRSYNQPVDVSPPPSRVGPSPLDPYLKHVSNPEASPYPKLHSKRRKSGDVVPPVPQDYAEAKELLQQIQKDRSVLESNLNQVMRSRHDAKVYSVLETQLSQDSLSVERGRIMNLVDNCITSLQKGIDREVQQELINMEAKKAMAAKSGGQSQSIRPGVRGQGLARVDTGIRKGQIAVPDKQRKAPQTTMTQKFTKDEDFLTKTYGKAAYQKGRTTVKDPYLHFQNTAKPRRARSPSSVPVKGTELKSSKTQTTPSVGRSSVPHQPPPPGPVSAPKQYYFSPDTGYIPLAVSNVSPVPGQLVPMAIPLHKPRLERGLRMPESVPVSARETVVSPPHKPLVTAGTNVAMVTIPTEDDDKIGRTPELSKQVLPPVDIDSMSETSSLREVYIEPPHSPNRSNFNTSYHYSHQEEESEEEEEEDFDQSGIGISLPGHQPRVEPEPSGPEFPPPVPKLMPQPSEITSDVLAEDLRQRDIVQNKAIEWIEQELMARVISEVYPLRPVDLIPAEPAPSVHTDDSVDDDSLLVVDTIGQKGMKLFVDAGQPVDNNLVNALVREVISEKLVTMLGQRTQEEDGQSQRQTDGHGEGVEDEVPEHIADEVDRHQESPRQGHIQTPQPTPKSSPVMSPVRVVSPPVTPADSPVDEMRMLRQSERRVVVSPPPQVLPVIPVVPFMEPESEPETSVSFDISEELRHLRANPDTEEPSYFPDSRHDVVTPTTTPPPPELPHDEPIQPPPLSPPPALPEEPVAITPPVTQPEPEPIPQEKKETPPSPKPWGNPDSPRPEENPDYGIPSQNVEPPKPQLTSVATQVEQPSPPRRRTPSPPSPQQRRSPSPGLSEMSSSPVTSITETINESVSEGQWLLSRSEGQAAPFPYEEVTRQQGARHTDISTASTLRDTDDIDLDDTEVSKSEGEFLYRMVMEPERDPMLQYVLSAQQAPILPAYSGHSYGQFDIPQGRVDNLLHGTGKSTGEISLGQVAPHKVTYITASQDMEEQEETGGAEYSPTKDTSMRLEDLKESRRQQQQLQQQQQQQTSPPSRSPPPRRPGGGVVSAMPRSRSPTERARARKPPQATRFSDPLETEPTRNSRIINIRTSSEELRGSMDADHFPNGTQTMSDQGTRTMTPDQMNADQYMQSGYLSQTLSQSDGMASGRLTGTLGQSGTREFSSMGSMRASSEMSRSGGISPDRLHSSGRSLGLTYSFESEEGDSMSENELRRLAGSGPIKMSVKLPSTGVADDSEDLSEIDITDQQ